ncbi:hypothetical protein [Vibrio sp. SCSIO 43137]|uniref:hypothetical protein n=1 Tax=Vibrio sp. SCSIO 43137 TaxID=3021011 RepID=UPI0023074C81|nr:hypothetical protein [Vibrio sp. SCSIO 43137]WCE30848.1 hypothetical protein PK654_06155 [Vibrio sp. SCSIO 43137]
MSAIKALKKLKKTTKKISKPSVIQLQQLKKSDSASAVNIQADLKKLSGQVTLDIVSELAAPLNPILSWFGSNHHAISNNGFSAITSKPVIRSVSNSQPEGKVSQIALARVPLKSPPCKKCPALSGSNCKCAMKKFA